jgi:hypothetical protein
MGRQPEGAQALSGAERQARYRTRHANATDTTPPPRQPPPTRTRAMTRAQRWDTTVGALVTLQAEYAAWLEAMPEATHDSPTGQALQAIVDLDLDELIAIRPPRGFGRD